VVPTGACLTMSVDYVSSLTFQNNVPRSTESYFIDFSERY